MEKFEVHILGCGSALPTTRHNPSSQVISLRDKLYMIDCGEGTQLQMRKESLKFGKLNHIFISHLHGDHCFGLIGLISTFSLLGRTNDLYIHCPKPLDKLLSNQLKFFCNNLSFNVVFKIFDTTKNELIWQDKTISVETLPLDHRVACCGFLFKESALLPHIKKDMIDFYKIPNYAINNIKLGADWIDENQKVIPNNLLVFPADKPRSYAYCSDTAYIETLPSLIQDTTVLYHEATFGEKYKTRATETKHSTAIQAATIAKMSNVKKLIIGHYSARYTDETPLLEEAQTIFKETRLANEGQSIKIE